MAIGERIRYIRKKHNMTQKYLGLQLGFGEKNADSRVAQYENGRREPKSDMLKEIAGALQVSTLALNSPNLDDHIRLMHTLFTIEDIYGLTIERINGKLCLVPDESRPECFTGLYSCLNEWNEIKDKVKSGEMTQGQYDDWRYNYPEDLPENIINTLDHCWEKAKQENKKREKNYNPFNEPQKDLLAEFEKIKKEHAEKENEE